MGARDVFRMEPNVFFGSYMEGEIVILNIISSRKYFKSAIYRIFSWSGRIFCFFRGFRVVLFGLCRLGRLTKIP